MLLLIAYPINNDKDPHLHCSYSTTISLTRRLPWTKARRA